MAHPAVASQSANRVRKLLLQPSSNAGSMAFATVRKSRGVLSGGRAASSAPAEHVPALVEGSGRRANGRTTQRLRRRPTAQNAPPPRLDGQAGGRVTGARAAEFSQSPNDGCHSARVGTPADRSTPRKARSAALCGDMRVTFEPGIIAQRNRAVIERSEALDGGTMTALCGARVGVARRSEEPMAARGQHGLPRSWRRALGRPFA
jgi:hypothetical protein